MKKISIRVLAMSFALAMILVVSACNEGLNEEIPEENVPLAQLNAGNIEQPDSLAQLLSEESNAPETKEISTVEDYSEMVLGVVSATSDFSDYVAVDSSVIITFGGEGAPVLTFERLQELIEQALLSVNFYGVGLFSDSFIENNLIQIRMMMSEDEDENAIVRLGMPMETGGFYDLLQIILVDDVVYIGTVQYIEIVDWLLSLAVEVMRRDMQLSALEAHMAAAHITEILTVFENIDYVSVTLSDFIEMGGMDFVMDQPPEMYDVMEDAIDFFNRFFDEAEIMQIVEENEMISVDGDWVIISFDQRGMQTLLEPLIDFMDDNAIEFIDIINQMMEVTYTHNYPDDSYYYGPYLTVRDLREALAEYDPSIFDYFTGEFSIAFRYKEELLAMQMSVVINVDEIGFPFQLSIETQTTPRKSPIIAPTTNVITWEELVEKFTEVEELMAMMDIF